MSAAFRFFAGKGGVGKTTCAAAAALAAAARHRVLLVSTDPAHSLGDVVAERLGPRPRRLAGTRGRLAAVEMDADAALARWLRGRRRALATIAERGTYLDEEDLGRLLRLSLPGVDELIGLVELTRLARETPCDEVVVDTAPTGHTLRLLEMPETLARIAAVLDGMHAKHRFLAESLGGAYRPDASDALIAEIEGHARDLAALLRDPARAAFTWVMLPEALSLAEARDGVAALDRAGLAVAEVVVNRVTAPSPPGARRARASGRGGTSARACPWCAERMRAEAAVIGEARAAFAGRPLRCVAACGREPIGLPALRRLSRQLVGPAWRPPARPASPTARARVRAVGAASPAWLDAVVPAGARLVIVLGKGGVGKTTCAAAIAQALARRDPPGSGHGTGARVLLLSADPAHSIGDVLQAPLDDTPARVPGAPPGLEARELDASRALADSRARYREGVQALFGALRGESRFEPVFDRAVLENLIELAPPGIDELFATLSIIEALQPAADANAAAGTARAAYDVVVLDTAPTGHALRLLALPDAALEWVRALLAILLKYRAVTGLGSLAANLVDVSRNLRALHALLRDRARTCAVVVTRPAGVPRAETTRLLAALRRLGIAVSAVVVNGLAPARCAGCAAGAAGRRRDGASAEARALAAAGVRAPAASHRATGRGSPRAAVVLAAPAEAVPPRGPAALARWAATWRPVTA